MRLLIKFQSISDIITNSSSEVFIAKANKKTIDTLPKVSANVKISFWEDIYNEWKSDFPENKQQFITPEIWSCNYKEDLETLKQQVWIDIDSNEISTIDWILENLWVTRASMGFYEKDPKTQRLVRRVTEEEWDMLSRDKKY